MRVSREPISSLRDEDLIDLFSRRLPDLLERRPDLEPTLFHAFLKTFARREDVALVPTELRALRTGTESGFEQVDRRIDQFRAEVADRFDQVERSIASARSMLLSASAALPRCRSARLRCTHVLALWGWISIALSASRKASSYRC